MTEEDVIHEYEFEIHVLIESTSKKEALDEFRYVYGSDILEFNGYEIYGDD